MSKPKAIAAKPLLYDLSMDIYSIEHGIDDEVEYGYSNDDETFKSTIEYDVDSGRPYFMDNTGDKQYLDDFIRIDEGKSVKFTSDKKTDDDKKSCIYEALTDADIEVISQLDVTEEELAIILNLLEFIDDEKKDDAISLITLLFENKKLVDTESETEVPASEKYTSMLLNGGK